MKGPMDIARRNDCTTLSYDEKSGTFWLRGRQVPLPEVWRIQRKGEFTWIDGTYLLWFQCNFASKAEYPVAAPAFAGERAGGYAQKTLTGALSVSVVAVILVGFALFSGTAFNKVDSPQELSAKEQMQAAQQVERTPEGTLKTAGYQQKDLAVTSSVFH